MLSRFSSLKQAAAGSVLLAAVLVAPVVVSAGQMATDAQIVEAVSGKSLQGSMLKDTFAEYYAPDGSIKGKGNTGKWRVSNNAMCFQYGDKPEGCWQLELNGPALTLYKDGKVDGNGILVEGNPHNF